MKKSYHQWSVELFRYIQSSLNHSHAVLAVCSESLFCWKVNLWPRLRSRVLCSRFLSSLSPYFTISCFSPISFNLSVAASIKENNKNLNIWDDGGHCALANLHCRRSFFVAFPRSVPQHSKRSLVLTFKGIHIFSECLWYILQKWTNKNKSSLCHAEVWGDGRKHLQIKWKSSATSGTCLWGPFASDLPLSSSSQQLVSVFLFLDCVIKCKPAMLPRWECQTLMTLVTPS